jgi:hypothetical protein
VSRSSRPPPGAEARTAIPRRSHPLDNRKSPSTAQRPFASVDAACSRSTRSFDHRTHSLNRVRRSLDGVHHSLGSLRRSLGAVRRSLGAEPSASGRSQPPSQGGATQSPHESLPLALVTTTSTRLDRASTHRNDPQGGKATPSIVRKRSSAGLQDSSKAVQPITHVSEDT